MRGREQKGGWVKEKNEKRKESKDKTDKGCWAVEQLESKCEVLKGLMIEAWTRGVSWLLNAGREKRIIVHTHTHTQLSNVQVFCDAAAKGHILIWLSWKHDNVNPMTTQTAHAGFLCWLDCIISVSQFFFTGRPPSAGQFEYYGQLLRDPLPAISPSPYLSLSLIM